jgi:heme/copper-type cytochrome/quinol oxidase subunit 2
MVFLMRKVIGIAVCVVSLVATLAAETADRVVKVTAQRYHFHPAEIRVNKGELVELVFTSLDTDHGVLIPHLMLRKTIPPKGKGELKVRFRANQLGSWYFESSEPSGASHTLMRGVVVIK